jgi:hypothetical protein
LNKTWDNFLTHGINVLHERYPKAASTFTTYGNHATLLVGLNIIVIGLATFSLLTTNLKDFTLFQHRSEHTNHIHGSCRKLMLNNTDVLNFLRRSIFLTRIYIIINIKSLKLSPIVTSSLFGHPAKKPARSVLINTNATSGHTSPCTQKSIKNSINHVLKTFDGKLKVSDGSICFKSIKSIT